MNTLDGLSIVVTRHGPKADELCERLRALGAIPVRLPTIAVRPPGETAPLDAALRSLGRYDWVVFTSANGVQSAMTRMKVLGLGPDAFSQVRVAAVGPATARALTESGVAVAAVPTEYQAERIVAIIADATAPGRTVLLLRADIAGPELPRLLAGRGVHVDDITAYCTVSAVPDAESIAALRGGVDVITFTSPSTVRGLLSALGSDWREKIGGALIASIGPVTSKAARELGVDVQIEAVEYTTDGLLRALCDYHGAHSESGTDT